jgi:hypothetical protein
LSALSTLSVNRYGWKHALTFSAIILARSRPQQRTQLIVAQPKCPAGVQCAVHVVRADLQA